MPKTIVQLWVEVHTAEDGLTPEEREQSVITDLGAYAGLNSSSLLVVRANSYYEPEPTPTQAPVEPPQDPVEFGTD